MKSINRPSGLDLGEELGISNYADVGESSFDEWPLYICAICCVSTNHITLCFIRTQSQSTTSNGPASRTLAAISSQKTSLTTTTLKSESTPSPPMQHPSSSKNWSMLTKTKSYRWEKTYVSGSQPAQASSMADSQVKKLNCNMTTEKHWSKTTDSTSTARWPSRETGSKRLSS